MTRPERAPAGFYASCAVVVLSTETDETWVRPFTVRYERPVTTSAVESDVLRELRADPDAVPEGHHVVGVFVSCCWEVRA